MNLTQSQNDILTATAPAIAVIAGPGSGKTTVAKARYAMQTPEAALQTVIITFTAAGAQELRERIRKDRLPEPGFMGTLHAFMLCILRLDRPHLVVLDEKQADELVADTLAEIRSKVTAPALRRALMEEKATQAETVAIMRYRANLLKLGAEDYDTLLLSGLEAIQKTPLQVDLLIVDEYQDSGRLDHEIYATIDARQRFYVGDPDQSIYGFRGGLVANLLEFAEAPGTFTAYLDENFRCAKVICEAATRLVSHNRGRLEKSTISRTGKEGMIRVAGFDSEAEELASTVQNARLAHAAGGTVAVLSRFNSTRQAVADALRQAGIPVSEPATLSRPDDWRLALAMLRLGSNQFHPLSVRDYLTLRDGKEAYTTRLHAAAMLRTELKLPLPDHFAEACEISKLSMAAREMLLDLVLSITGNLEDWKAAASEVLVREMELQRSAPPAGDGVEVLTIHASKGREFQRVILPAWDEGPTAAFPNPNSLEEDRRLAFVALTRAKEEIIITWSLTRRNPYGRKPMEDRAPSRFLTELQPKEAK